MLHVYPLGDLREHQVDTDVADCWCCPEEDEGLILHHSADGREAYERSERTPH
jgi:hypothetical protein